MYGVNKIGVDKVRNHTNVMGFAHSHDLFEFSNCSFFAYLEIRVSKA